MTEVLSIPHHGSHDTLTAQSRQTASQSTLFLQAPQTYSRSTPYYRSQSDQLSYETRLHFPESHSAPSSAPSSPTYNLPDFSRQPSYNSTPSSSFSSRTHTCEDDDDNYFPSYDSYSKAQISAEAQDPEPLPSPESTTTSSTASSPPLSSALSRSSLYDPASAIGDDMAMRTEPTRHVDYLSHTWREEDIWASWRHVVSWKKLYGNGARLENASWRTWAKSKYRLKTMSPEDLNWMKDHDVTWLYGPLQIGNCLQQEPSSLPVGQISRCNSFGVKKTILKKRSVSEVMLQRSLSSSTLMKQATDALRAQQIARKTGGSRPFGGAGVEPRVSDFISLSGDETPVTRTTTGLALSSEPSSSTSGVQTPSTGKRIHFNDKVEQCIAINCDTAEDNPYHVHSFADDSDSSEDELLMMAPVRRGSRSQRPSTPRPSFSNESKTIARLPATTLNYRGDTPEPDDESERRRQWHAPPGTPFLASSSSEQTLRPSSRSQNFLMDDEDDADVGWQPSAARRGSIFPQGGYRIRRDDDDSDDGQDTSDETAGPGKSTPYDEEEEEDAAREGIFGKVVDTVNTAKDIAHVIWNVGWRGS